MYMLPPSKRKKIAEAERVDIDDDDVKEVNGDDSVDDHKEDKSRSVYISPGPEVVKLIFITLLSMKFILLINAKMPTAFSHLLAG